MGRIGLVHLEAIAKAPGVTPVIVSNPTVSKAEVRKFKRMKKFQISDPSFDPIRLNEQASIFSLLSRGRR